MNKSKPSKARKFVKLSEITYKVSVGLLLFSSCALLAYKLYSDSKQEQVIIDYNRSHSGIIKKYDDKELLCLEEGIYHEIRNGTKQAMKNVAYVILNRKESKGFPDTICEVLAQPKQFSYRDNKPPHKDWQEHILSKHDSHKDKQALLTVKVVASKVLAEGSKDNEILYYTTPEVKRKWMKGLKVKYNDGYHKHFAPKKDDMKRV